MTFFRNTFFICISLVLSATSFATAKEHIVKVMSGKSNEMRFTPQDITINQGDTVKWINEKSVYHNIRSIKKGTPDGAETLKSPALRKENDSWSYTFNVTGRYDYFCVPHRSMGMIGSITVEDKPLVEDK